MTGTAAELVPGSRDRRPHDRHRRARSGHAGAPARLRRRAPRPRSALRRVARRRRGAERKRGRMTHIELYDTTLRDGMQGEGMSLSAQEKLRVAHRLDELGIDVIEAGFPSSNPKELELFGLLAGETFRHARIAAFGMTRRRDSTADADPGLRVLAESIRPGVHDRRQDLGPSPREGREGRSRREPADDLRVGRVPRRRGQARDLRRRALLRRVRGRPRVRAHAACGRPPRPAPRRSPAATRTAARSRPDRRHDR